MNSALAGIEALSPNHSRKRTARIDRITPHCVVGQWSARQIGEYFLNPAVRSSCNYGIGKDGAVCLCVDEGNRSWCSSSNANDQRAVTIECASDASAPYAMTGEVWESLVALCTDICARNGKDRLVWIEDKSKALSYSPGQGEMVITVHRWFANKDCPGEWLFSRLGRLAEEVTERLAGVLPAAPFQAAVKTGMNIRREPTVQSAVAGSAGQGVYTVTATAGCWGRLKSGAGWIYLGNPEWTEAGEPGLTDDEKSQVEEAVRGAWWDSHIAAARAIASGEGMPDGVNPGAVRMIAEILGEKKRKQE